MMDGMSLASPNTLPIFSMTVVIGLPLVVAESILRRKRPKLQEYVQHDQVIDIVVAR